MDAKTMRENAESCRTLAENAPNEPARKRFLRMVEAWETLAVNQAWLDGEKGKEAPPVQS